MQHLLSRGCRPLLIFMVVLLWSGPVPLSLYAQTPCGSITDADGEVTEISDCEYPFGETEPIDGVFVQFGTTEFEDGDAYEVVFDRFEKLTVLDGDIGYMSRVELFYHEGMDYVSEGVFPDPARGVTIAQSLTEEEALELYERGFNTPDSLGRAYKFEKEGTYTLVVVEEHPPVLSQNETKTFLGKTRSFFVPTAHAYDFAAAKRIETITFTVTEAPEKASNIMFLPGFQASRLYTKRLVSENQLWTPFIDGDDVGKLALDDSGVSLNEIYTKDIVAEAGDHDVYGSLVKRLEILEKKDLINDLRAFPYDWRYDVHDIVQNGTRYEDGSYVHPTSTLAGLAQLSATEKVTIIAHSNGGLLAKAMLDELEKNGRADLVDRVIFIGSPQLGATKTVGSFLHGYGQEITIKDLYTLVPAETARYVSQNMPGGYSLLPSEELMQHINGPLVTFTDEESTSAYHDAYGGSIDTAAEFHAFLLGTGDGRVQPEREDLETPAVLNESMLMRAEENHSHWRDWRAPEGTEVITIVGTGIHTAESFHYRQEEVRNCTLFVFCDTENVLDYEVGMSTKGDGTVLAASAAHYGDVYYIDMQQFNTVNSVNTDHAVMSGIEPVTALLEYLVTEGDDLPQYVSRSTPDVDTDGVRISTHSPVVFAVTDEKGRRTGIVVHEDGTRELLEEIPNSYVIETPESIYVGLADGSEVEIDIIGTGNGAFDLEIAHTKNGKVTSSSRQQDVPVSTTTKATAELDESGELTTFTVDTDGDGTTDIDVLATTTEETVPPEVEIEPEEDDNDGGVSGGYISPSEEPEGRVLGVSTMQSNFTRSDIESAIAGVKFLHQHGRISIELYEALTQLLELILVSDFLFEESNT